MIPAAGDDRMRIVDAHVHLGEPYRPAFGTEVTYTADQLIGDMDRAGVDCSVIIGIPHAYDNDYTLQAARAYPDRLLPFAYIDPWHHPDPRSSFARLADSGFVGVKLRAVSLRYNLADRPLMEPIFEACEASSLPILLHTGEDATSTPLQAGAMARRYPRVTVLLAHAGFRTLAEEAIQVALECPNVYLDQTAGTSHQLSRGLAELGAERLIYGSDAPYMDTRVELEKVRVTVKDEEAARQILGGNIMRILGSRGGTT